MKKQCIKILSMVLVFIVITGFVPISKDLIEHLTIKATAASTMLGDLDNDQKVTAADARLVLRAAVGLETFNSDQTPRADIDFDKKITAADARLILRAAVGLEDFLSLNDNSQTVDENKKTEFKNGDTIYVETEEHLVFDKSSSTHFYDNLILVYTFTRTDDVTDNYLASLVDGIIVGKLTGCINLLQIMVTPCDYNQITSKCRILAEDENVLSARFEIPFHVENTTKKTSSYDSDPWSGYQKYPITDKNDEVIGGNDWWAEAIGAYDAWMKTDNIIQQIRIGIIDDGFYIEHPDLKEKISVLTDYYPYYDGDNHGTKVAGLIAASNNDFGIRGVCNSAELLCIDRTGSDGKGELLTEIQFVEATKHLLEQGCRVINNSYARWFITESEYQKKLRDGDIDVDEYPSLESYNNAVISYSANSAIAYMEMIVGLLTSKETINNQFMFVHAAGNGYDNNATEGFDAQYAGFYAGINNELYKTYYSEKKQQKLLELGASFNDIKNHIIVVGAVNKTPTQSGNYYLTTWSNFGDTVDLCAPGDDVFSTVFAQTTRQYSFGSKVYTCDFGSGTSLAAPIVSGSAALLWAVDSSLSAKEVKDYLCRNTPHIAIGVGKNDAKPYPMLHIGNAIDRLLKDKEKIGTVSGFVKDSATEKPLSDVTVTFTNNESEATYSATTDETGAFNSVVPYGDYSVEFSKDGYEYYGMALTIDSEELVLLNNVLLTINNFENPNPEDTQNPDNLQTGDHIQFGSYPQNLVRDEALITDLSTINKSWISYEYYSGTGSSYDEMTSSDYMKYADFFYGKEKYRAVKFSDYRPYYTYKQAYDHFQTGFQPNVVYYFKYEPLEWRILDASTGLVLCENVIDAQPFQEYFYRENTSFWCDKGKTASANNYVYSSIRKWLTVDFYQTVFTDAQKDIIKNNEQNIGGLYDDYINDTIFLLSANDICNTSYGFGYTIGSTLFSSGLKVLGTDYSKIQGWHGDFWRLRSVGTNRSSASTHNVKNSGTLSFEGFSLDRYDYTSNHGCIFDTSGGIRPACFLKILVSDNSISTSLFSETKGKM